MTHQIMTRPVVGARERERFAAEGYCVLPSVLPGSLLNLIREECDQAMATVHREMERLGIAVLGGSRRGRQYTPGNCRLTQPRLREFLFSDLVRDVCRSLLGAQAYLVWDQFSVKIGSVG